ncbi:helicase associated domain-containing family [Cryptosporidium sp. chipmunk genotype I]|uniref:helicase associated domain-containing family n=1 Tax=Cryptosporidium sp. chipmunk genotype I TaxID=1280935 RepID=UPI00351AA1D2|nr:helicase associated domain-containing family [Cryptosporidium sp. chipmunk genotype I]
MSKKTEKTANPDSKMKKGISNSGSKNILEDSQEKKSISKTNINSVQTNGEEMVKKIPLFEMKPYMRTPKLLLNNYCQREKRPKPIYNKLVASEGMFRYVVILNDPKCKEENSMRFETRESFINNELAQHYAALLALRHLEGSRPLYKLFPAPLDEAWLSMDTSHPLVSRNNEFVSQKEKALFEGEKKRKQAEKKNKIDISGQKQKLEIPTLSMSYNIRKRTIGIVNKHFPMLSKSYSFKSWLFDNCNTFSGLPRSVSKPKLASLNLEWMNDKMKEKYSSFLKSNGFNLKMVLLSLKYWYGIDNKDKEGIIKLVESCGFDTERSLTALNIVMKEIDEYNKSGKDLFKLQKGVYMDHFRISNICIITDIEIFSYPKHYIAWLCIMWLSIHLKENDLPQLISPKKAQIEVKDYSNSKESKKEEIGLISNNIKNLFISSLESYPVPDYALEEISKSTPKPLLRSSNIFKVCRYDHLSASKNAEKIIEKLKFNQILVVKGETGCGKTTQIPILVYEGITQFTEGMIYCSEPRRLAAVSVSTRVRSEVIKENQHVKKDLVGHSVRLDHSVTNNTKLVYCTHGILINIIKSELMGISSSSDIDTNQFRIPSNSVLILDEAHERSLDVDLLLYFMKQLAYQRSDIKLVIMSASIDVFEFVKYFNKSFNDKIESNTNSIITQGKVDHIIKEAVFQIDTINLPGRTPFPIEVSYLPLKQKTQRNTQFQDNSDNFTQDNEELLDFGSNICKPLDIPKLKDHVLNIIKSLGNKEGSVLIFLGGIGDVNHLTKLLKREFEDNEQDQENYENSKEKVELPIPLHVLACHSNVNYNDQLEIFKSVKGKRKVIVSTNIAEVSLTIEDIRFVIDTGRVRISIYDPIRHVTSLQEVLISKSSAQQRMGRAGRTAPGKCFRIFTEEELQSQPLEITPEILRLPIEHIILDILCYLGHLGSDKDSNLERSRGLRNSFKLIQLIHSLQDFFTPPKLSSIETSLLSLRNYGALDDHFRITPLGELLSKWPVDLSIGILFIYGLIFDCIDPIVTIASFLTCEIPWKLEERRLPKSSTNCDYMIFIKVYNFYVEHFKSISKYKSRNPILNLEDIENHNLPFDPKCLDISKMETIYQTRKHLFRVLSIQEVTEKINEAQIFSKWNLIQTCLAASLYPNVACIRLPKRIKYVESGSGLFAETIQFNKLLLYRKNRLSKKSIGHFFTPQPKEKPITISQAYDLVKESEDVSRVFLSESSAIYNRMYDLGTYHCIMYMNLFQSFAQNKTVLRFPISISMYSLLLFASDSLQLNPISLINQMKKVSLNLNSDKSKKSQTNNQNQIDPEDSLNHILIDDWILLQCPGQIQSILWYFRYVVRDFIQFLSQKLLESKSKLILCFP